MVLGDRPIPLVISLMDLFCANPLLMPSVLRFIVIYTSFFCIRMILTPYPLH